MINRAFLLLILLATGFVQAQQYRWVDEKGRLHISDTHPGKVKDLRKAGDGKTDGATKSPAKDQQQLPFELQQALKDFPVTLYTSPPCKEPCELARTALNRRGVPFTEVQVWNPATHEQLKSRAGSDGVPALVVGRSALSGFEQSNYDGLLDSAGYPRLGALKARSQPAPPPPEGYQAPLVAEPLRPETAVPAKPGPYDPSGLKSNQTGKSGPYLVPGRAN